MSRTLNDVLHSTQVIIPDCITSFLTEAAIEGCSRFQNDSNKYLNQECLNFPNDKYGLVTCMFSDSGSILALRYSFWGDACTLFLLIFAREFAWKGYREVHGLMKLFFFHVVLFPTFATMVRLLQNRWG